MASKLTRRFRLPAAAIRQAAPLQQRERMDLLGRVLTDHDPPLRSRVAAAMVLLYAQPLSRVVRLTVDDVVRDGDQILLGSAAPRPRSPDRSPISCSAGSRTGTT